MLQLTPAVCLKKNICHCPLFIASRHFASEKLKNYNGRSRKDFPSDREIQMERERKEADHYSPPKPTATTANRQNRQRGNGQAEAFVEQRCKTHSARQSWGAVEMRWEEVNHLAWLPRLFLWQVSAVWTGGEGGKAAIVFPISTPVVQSGHLQEAIKM